MIPARRFTHDPFRLGSTAKAFPPVAASFWLDARLVRDLSSAYLRGNKNLPSDFCHPKLSTQICTRALVARRSTRIRTRPLRGTRRFTPTEPASAGPLECRQGVGLPASRRSSPLTPLSRSPLASPVSQPSEVCRTRRGDFHPCRRDANTSFHHRRRLPPVSIRAPSLRRFAGSGEVTARAETTRLETRERGRLRRLTRRRPPFATAGPRSSEDARGVLPRRLAPACLLPRRGLLRAWVARFVGAEARITDFCRTRRTHGHTRTSP